MADAKITALTADASPSTDDLVVTVNDPGGSPANRKVTLANVSALVLAQTTFTDHSARHENGGADEISVAGLSGLLADGQTPATHATTHQSGGADAIKLDDLSAPDDNTDLNASTSAHGLMPKGDNTATHFYNGQMGQTTPDHGSVGGLTDDDHAQYALLLGRAGGQTIIGGTGSGDDLVLQSTSHATRGQVFVEYIGTGAVPAIGASADTDTGIAWPAGNRFDIITGGSSRLQIDTQINANVAIRLGSGKALISASTASGTVPNFNPVESDTNTGIGSAGADLLSDIAGGAEITRHSAGVSGVSNGMTTLRAVEPNVAGSGAPNVLIASESRRAFTNEGAMAESYHTLPTAAAGLEFVFYCHDTDGIRVVANTGDTIRIAGSVSASAGFIKSTVIGSSIHVLAINATEWVAINTPSGTWTIDS